MNDKLQQIIDSSVISPCEEKVTISKEGFDWLISQAEKVEQLQKQLERKEQALEEMFQNRERWRISHGELEQELQQKKEKEKQYKEALENIQALSFFTNFTDTERFNAALHHAELVLKETK